MERLALFSSCAWWSWVLPLLRESEEEKSGAMRARDRLCHGAERAIRLTLKSEAVFEDFDLERPVLVTARQDRSRPRQPVIDRHAKDRVWFLHCSAGIGGRRQAQIGIGNQFRSAPAGPFGQVAFSLGLQ